MYIYIYLSLKILVFIYVPPISHNEISTLLYPDVFPRWLPGCAQTIDVMYHPQTGTFASVASTGIKLWDARTGDELQP